MPKVKTPQTVTARPPYDPEIAAALAVAPPTDHILLSGDPQTWRAQYPSNRATIDQAVSDRRIRHEELQIRGPGPQSLTLSVISPHHRAGRAPGIFFIHGGGLMAGDRFSEAEWFVDWAAAFGIVAISVDYRLAPEHGFPAGVEDCRAGLQWVAEQSGELGIDAERLLIGGVSAGGGLAAATALMNRDQGGPELAGQLLLSPMLDDRDRTWSSIQFEDGPWCRAANRMAWQSLLGDAAGGPDVSPYAAPSRADDLSGLPPAFLEVGSAEVLRDETVDYASRLWAAGGQAELHVWGGGSHGFDVMTHSALAHAATAARDRWLERTLDVVRSDVTGWGTV